MKLRSLSHSLRLSLLTSLAFSTLAFAENKLPDIAVDAAPLERTHENSFAPIVEKVSPSVVTISISRNMRADGRDKVGGDTGNPFLDNPFFREFQKMREEAQRGNNRDNGAEQDTGKRRKRMMAVSLGNGVIVSKDGCIITNNHVVEQADEITVTLADGKTEMKAKKIGNDSGSDIAVIKIEAKDLKPITFADSDKIKGNGVQDSTYKAEYRWRRAAMSGSW